MNLRELVDTVDVPETRVAEAAWDLRRPGYDAAGPSWPRRWG